MIGAETPLKRCSICKIEKPATEEFFYPKGKLASGGPYFYSYCRPCAGSRMADKMNALAEQLRARLIEAKSVPCKDCGHQFHFSAMQFDHIDPSNKKRTGKLDGIKACRNLAALNEEIAKCEVVCANCHAVRTWLRSVGRPITDRAGLPDHCPCPHAPKPN